MTSRAWRVGDRVMHVGRPEWGSGEIRAVEDHRHEGVATQRLTIRFDHGGVKRILTMHADLRPVSAGPSMPEGSPAVSLAAEPRGQLAERAATLPDEATDPFRDARRRLEATLALYRFTPSGGSLLEWASLQTGLADPLTEFNRHELEDLFARFRRALDQHLSRLVGDMRRQDPAALAEVTARAAEPGRRALTRVNVR